MLLAASVQAGAGLTGKSLLSSAISVNPAVIPRKLKLFTAVKF